MSIQMLVAVRELIGRYQGQVIEVTVFQEQETQSVSNWHSDVIGPFVF